MPEINERGNMIYRDYEADRKVGTYKAVLFAQRDYDLDRYLYDNALAGWKQYDTWQDASYFGVWVNIAERMIFTYAEGYRSLVVCPTLESFKAELANAAEFYGPSKPACVVLTTDGGREEIYDDRPTGDPGQQFGESAIRRALR